MMVAVLLMKGPLLRCRREHLEVPAYTTFGILPPDSTTAPIFSTSLLLSLKRKIGLLEVSVLEALLLSATPNQKPLNVLADNVTPPPFIADLSALQTLLL